MTLLSGKVSAQFIDLNTINPKVSVGGDYFLPSQGIDHSSASGSLGILFPIKNKFKLDTSENPVVLYRARVNPHLEQYTAGYINQKDSCSAALNLLPSGKELEKEKKELLMNMMMTVINTPSLHKEFLKMVEEIKKEG